MKNKNKSYSESEKLQDQLEPIHWPSTEHDESDDIEELLTIQKHFNTEREQLKTQLKYDKEYRQQLLDLEEGSEEEKFAKMYPFSVDNVKEFADFCWHSNGFRIW